MIIEDFGARVASVWEGLRPATRNIVERALLASQSSPSPNQAGATYDMRSEWELSRLLAALDERVAERGTPALNAEQSREIVRVAETCAAVLHRGARTAEVFAQLLERALAQHDYARVDELADVLAERLAPGETCELTRHPNPAVRALAHEALMQTPVTTLISLLSDPVDAEVAREALEHQADEFDSDEARMVLNALEYADGQDESL